MVNPISFGIVLFAVAFGVAIASTEEEPLQIDAKIEVVQDIAAFKAAHPELDVVPLEVARSTRQQIVYTLGNRLSGDRLVGTSQDGTSWSSLQDVTLNLRYPQAGSGAVVSYVQVVVNQSSNQGRGYVVSGGIGQRYIQLVIEVYSTSYFQYNAQIYGY
ncbi:AAEL013885-PA [Aedes aegypti]|uniref:AAEL013885-PA n=1 Tax=Aedes aegypti TaxID=7159 RepID=Q16HV9_AEDAE|nr:AAEL013885-PA [Aedes aegypti]